MIVAMSETRRIKDLLYEQVARLGKPLDQGESLLLPATPPATQIHVEYFHGVGRATHRAARLRAA